MALPILPLVPAVASASTLTASSGSIFDETLSFPDGTTTFHHALTQNGSDVYAVDITLDSFGDWGSVTFDAHNFSHEDVAFTLNFMLPLDPMRYDEAYSSITGNGTWSMSSFVVSGASLVLDEGPSMTNLGVDVSSGCPFPSSGSSFTCETATADAVFAPQAYDTVYGTLAFSMGGLGSGVTSQANQLLWDGYFELDPVPEPAGLWLIGGGLLALALRRERALEAPVHPYFFSGSPVM